MIDTEALRKKVIDLALQGKLTLQLPEDGNAEDLYAQIQEEKAKLINKSKIKKEKPLPEISDDEIPFEIPNTWKWVRWGSIVNVVSARRVHQSDWKKEGIPFYRAREIATLADAGVVNNDLFISEELYEEFSISGVPHAGDLMVTGVGTLGKTYVVQESERFYYKDASVLCFENYAGMIATFLKQVMESSLMRSQIDSNSGGTTVDTLTMVRMNQYLFPLPPLDEQKRIVKIIDEIFAQIDIIDTLQQQYESDLEVLKGKIIDAGICGKLTEQLPEDGNAEDLFAQIQEEKARLINEGKIKKEKDLPDITVDEIPFEIPEHWKWCRLADISSTNIGLTYHPEDIVSDGTIVIRSSNIINSKMDYTDLVKVKCSIRENQYLNNNDIVICARNGSKALVGKCAIYEGDSYVVSFGAFMAVLRTPCYKYVFYYLHTDAFRRYFHSDDSKQINQVTQSILKEAVIPLPPLEEQRRIASRIEEIFTLLRI